jgi:methylmalonyl-CoA epimerase
MAAQQRSPTNANIYMIKGIDHIGIAVKSIDEAKKFWVDKLGLKISHIEDVPEQKVRVAMLLAGEMTIELLEPTAPDSPVAKFIEKRGEGLHHVTFQTDKLADRLKALKAAGVNLIDEKPRVGASGAGIAFLHPKSAYGVLVELCENPGRSGVPAATGSASKSNRGGDAAPTG